LFAYLQQGFAQLYMIIGIIIPLILTLILFIVSNSAQTYNRVSTLLKIIMILGLLYIISKNILF